MMLTIGPAGPDRTGRQFEAPVLDPNKMKVVRMWKEVLIGLTGLSGWALTLQLVKRRHSIQTPAAWGLSILFLLVFPDLFDLSARAYLAAIIIMTAGLIVMRIVRCKNGNTEGPRPKPPD
jgi:uncharacterized membrane protein YhaH (DUF805 family)